MITIKSKSEIELMREVCKLTGLMYKELEKHIKPGISTYELDKIAENFMKHMVLYQHKKDIIQE